MGPREGALIDPPRRVVVAASRPAAAGVLVRVRVCSRPAAAGVLVRVRVSSRPAAAGVLRRNDAEVDARQHLLYGLAPG